MNRRTFLRGLILTAAGLAVPPLALDEPVRRLWALDGTMLGAEAAQPEIVAAETMADAEAFAQSAGRVMALLQDSLQALDGLADFRAPDAAAIDDFAGTWREYRYPLATIQIEGQAYRARDLKVIATEGMWMPGTDPTLTSLQWTEPSGGMGVSPALRTIQGRDRALEEAP